jgi:hypothetical protein
MKGGAFVASDRGSHPVRRGLLRGGLLPLAATPLLGGLWALILPRSFYDDFPLPGSDWVSILGPYNEHLIQDYGALNLALTLLLVAAALLLGRRVVQVALVTWLVYATPHLVFHIGQTDHFSARSNVEQLSGLGLMVLLLLLLLYFAVPLGSKNAPENTIRPDDP